MSNNCVKGYLNKQYILDLISNYCKQCGTLEELYNEVNSISESTPWISCKTILPQTSMSVLICTREGNVTLAYWNDVKEIFVNPEDESLIYMLYEVDYWMNIPEVPQE